MNGDDPAAGNDEVKLYVGNLDYGVYNDSQQKFQTLILNLLTYVIDLSSSGKIYA